jgi:hypothetical protein
MGLAAARAEGRIGGMRHELHANQRKEAVHMVESGERTQAATARLFRVNRSVINKDRHLNDLLLKIKADSASQR